MNFAPQFDRRPFAWFAISVLLLQSLPAQETGGNAAQPAPQSNQNYYADAHPYYDVPLKQLTKQIPQLKDLHPVQNQQELPVILRKTGEQVDDFFRHVTDLTAREDITLGRLRQEKPFNRPELTGENVHDSYLILKHGNKNRVEIAEYRMDSKGENVDQAVIKQGYLVTSGFALSCNYFSTGYQPESTFRYLGDQKLGEQDTYVVGFAQQPIKATLSVTMKGRNGAPAHMLVQGIAWINKDNFQIVRMRTDLLAPRKDAGLNQQTTEVTLNKIQLVDVDSPLWLPSTVKVYVEFTTHDGNYDEYYELSYRNEHRYSDYQRYRVSSKVIPQ